MVASGLQVGVSQLSCDQLLPLAGTHNSSKAVDLMLRINVKKKRES